MQFSFVIPKDLHTKLMAEKAESGVPVAEIIRRAVEEYLQRKQSIRAIIEPSVGAEATWKELGIRLKGRDEG